MQPLVVVAFYPIEDHIMFYGVPFKLNFKFPCNIPIKPWEVV